MRITCSEHAFFGSVVIIINNDIAASVKFNTELFNDTLMNRVDESHCKQNKICFHRKFRTLDLLHLRKTTRVFFRAPIEFDEINGLHFSCPGDFFGKNRPHTVTAFFMRRTDL